MSNIDSLNPINSDQLFGMNNYFDDLLKLYKSEKFPKVILLSGKKGSGKFTLINHFLNYIFSKENYNLKEKRIKTDSDIRQKQLNGIFQNIIHVKNESDNKTKIEDIRNLKSLISKSNINNDYRFIILDDVEHLNLNSSNALLKVIEEPSKNNYFILINNQEKDLIKTISSRCLEIKIFIDKINTSKIIEALINKHSIEKIFEYENLDLSPGLFLKYNALCYENEIKMNLDYMAKIEKSLKLYKKSKDKMFINLSILFTNKYFYELSLKKRDQVLYFNSIKNKIIYYINDFFIYNLNLVSVLNLINTQFKYVR